MLYLLCLLVFLYVSPSCAWPHPTPTERTFNVEVEHQIMRLEGLYKNDTNEDWLRHIFFCAAHFDGLSQSKSLVLTIVDHDATGVADFHFLYEAGPVLGNKTDLDIEFFIPYVAEFSTESFPYYDGTNEVYSKFPTPGQNIEWEAWEGGSTIVDNVVVYNYTATNGIFTIGIHFAHEVATVGTLALDPNSIKIDFAVNNYTYASTPDKPSRLAIKSNLWSQTKLHNKGKKTVNSHKFQFGDDIDLPLGVFSWVPSALIRTADAGPIEIDVKTYIPTNENNHRGKDYTVYFSFLTPDTTLHPANILWDPRIGLDYEIPSDFCIGGVCDGPAIGIILASVAFVGLFIIGAVCIFQRRTGKEGYHSIN